MRCQASAIRCCTHYALVQYPQVFSKAGVFSPAYWTAQPSFDFVASKPVPKDARAFSLMGEKEGPQTNADVKRMAEVVGRTGHPPANTVLKLVPGGGAQGGVLGEGVARGVLRMFAPEGTKVASSK